MEGINKKILIMAIVMALCTSLLIYFYIGGMNSKEAEVQYSGVYVAKENIPSRVIIKEDMLTLVQMPQNINLPRGVSDKSKIIGKLTKERIIKGEPILLERLYTGEKNTMSYVVPKGKRAVSIGVNEVSEVGNFITPGDMVDIIATFDEKDKELQNKKIFYPKMTKVILQNIQVLGIGQNMSTEVKDDKKVDGKLPVSVTLAVTLEEAEKLILADESGVLRLALKPVSDTTQVQTPGIVRDDMTYGKGKIEFAK